MFICVDGSGPDSTAQYRAALRESFLAQIIRHNTERFARRYMGPTMTGDRQVVPGDIVDVICRRYDAGPAETADTRVFLAGYSRCLLYTSDAADD